ncbi:MAG: hypothetical protein J7M40_05295 [Planctomycetes bacterium]|nr:hypothetical protein [Planctomycetota bacterium]
MNKKNRGNLLEQHAEKIVLGVSGIISLGLLWLFVLSSPNAEKIGGRKYGPGEIDRYVKGQADRLEAALNAPPIEGPDVPADAMRRLYLAKLSNTISDVPDFQMTMVAYNSNAAEENRRYAVPQVGTVDHVAVEVIRGAAHVPVDEIGADNTYDKALTQLDDIDLVTVQASFDIGALYRNFTQSFIMGRGVKKDTELASPVFASAQLQRRRVLEGGGWSEWEVIPRPKIDPHRAMLSAPEKVDFDISVQKTRFRPFEIQRSILQPRPYNFASSNAVWLAPSFHKEYVKIAEREKKEAQRLERERIRDEKSRDRGRPTAYGGTQGRSRTSRGGAYAGDYGDNAYGANTRSRTTRQPVRGRRTNDPRRSRDTTGGRGDYYGEGDELDYGADYQRREPQTGTLDSVIAENRKVMIYTEQQLRDMKEPLVFWAHDDTVEPGNTYQYRIRLGVFNPIAGKNWFYPQEEQYKDQVVLWSEFAEIDEDVKIDPMIYFFPTGIAKTADKKVAIDVFKYYSGNWRSEAFDVHPGEMIGKLVDSKEPSPVASARDAYAEYDEYDAGMTTNTMPEKIDFDTGAMLVDIVKTDAWAGPRPLVRTRIADLLYTRDGVNMLHLPVQRSNWPSVMRVQYAKVDEASRETVDLQQGKNQTKVDLFGRQGRTMDRRMDSRRGDYDYDMEGGYMDSRLERSGRGY